MKTNYILIDLENVQPKNLEILKGHEFKVIVFVGSKQMKISFDLAVAMQSLGSTAVSYTHLDVYKRQDVTRYSVDWNGAEYINYCDGIANPRNPKFFRGERLLVREITSPTIYAAFTSDELYFDPSILVVLNNSESKITILSLLGILNSKLATFYRCV